MDRERRKKDVLQKRSRTTNIICFGIANEKKNREYVDADCNYSQSRPSVHCIFLHSFSSHLKYEQKKTPSKQNETNNETKT